MIYLSSYISSLSSAALLLLFYYYMIDEFCKVVWYFCLVPFPLFPLLLFYHYFIIIWCMNFAKMSDLLVSFPGFSDIKKIIHKKTRPEVDPKQILVSGNPNWPYTSLVISICQSTYSVTVIPQLARFFIARICTARILGLQKIFFTARFYTYKNSAMQIFFRIVYIFFKS